MRKAIITIISFVTFLIFPLSPAFAHVIVSPATVGIAKTQDFTVNVPNEKDNPIVGVKLLIPNGVTNVTPNALSNWTITTSTNGNGDNAAVTEIDWTDGSIPAGQRQEFIFQAQAPATETTISWKAYQTYSDGTVVSWDVDPKTLAKLSDEQQDALADKENKGEYSTTKVINDLATPQNATVNQLDATDQKATTALVFAIIAIAISCVSLSIARRKEIPTVSKVSSSRTSPTRKRKR